ncbi:hypothetical protein LB507_011436, partial [Fusarium sp. FIESC RH6]
SFQSNTVSGLSLSSYDGKKREKPFPRRLWCRRSPQFKRIKRPADCGAGPIVIQGRSMSGLDQRVETVLYDSKRPQDLESRLESRVSKE